MNHHEDTDDEICEVTQSGTVKTKLTKSQEERLLDANDIIGNDGRSFDDDFEAIGSQAVEDGIAATEGSSGECPDPDFFEASPEKAKAPTKKSFGNPSGMRISNSKSLKDQVPPEVTGKGLPKGGGLASRKIPESLRGKKF